MSESRIPNLFIVGAAKCGTSALSRYLAMHPAIYMSEQSRVKEPRFFSTDIGPVKRRFARWKDYFALFEPAPPTAKYLGEASVAYLHSRVAVPALLEMSPRAKLVVMLRNPVDVARSMHNQNIKAGHEAVLDFERAWRLQTQRGRGEKIPWACVSPHLLQYGDRASLGSQLQRLFRNAPRGQIHVIVHDDLLVDAAAVYAGVLDFLGLENEAKPEFSVVNASAQFRLPAVQKFLAGVKGVRQRLGLPGGLGIHKAISRFNAKSAPTSLRPVFRQELQEYFRGEVALLSKLLNRDLSHWLA